MQGLEVISSGLLTTVQDLGRSGWTQIGVPVSGAGDPFSAALANVLLGKDINSPVLECTLSGPKLKLLMNQQIVITGARMQLKVNNEVARHDTVIDVEAGSIIEIQSSKSGCRSYIAFSNDIEATNFLGSVSTYEPGKLGGLNGRALKKGDIIGFNSLDKNSIKSGQGVSPRFDNSWIIRVTDGPEFNRLSSNAKDSIENLEYIISNDSNRMGIRLEGPSLAINESGEMISGPVFTGTIQCPEKGLPILLGSDAQTLGGYPRILQVAKVDRTLIGQMRPGDQLTFQRISVEEAEKLWLNMASSFPFLSKI